MALVLERTPEHRHLAGHARDDAERGLDERRLTGSVRADDRRHGSGLDGEIHSDHDRLLAVADSQAGDRKRTESRRQAALGRKGRRGSLTSSGRVAPGNPPYRAARRPFSPAFAVSPPSARVITVTLWSIMPI